MENLFNYQEVPRDYRHCQNAECPRSANCLRYQVALRAGSDVPSFWVINPAYIAAHDECPDFHSDQLTRFALGISHLFDKLPHAKAIKIRKIIYAHLGKNMFYRILNKKRHITPEEQDFIREVFQKEGIEEEPVFDKYIDKYEWF